MPDENGVLSKEEKELAANWLSTRAPLLKCPSCKERNFSIAEHLISPMVFRGGNLVLGGPAYPQLMVNCTNCSHTMLFNAVMAGVVANAPEDGEADG